MNILFDGYLTGEGNATPLTGPNALKINTLDAFSLFDRYLTEGTQRPLEAIAKEISLLEKEIVSMLGKVT